MKRNLNISAVIAVFSAVLLIGIAALWHSWRENVQLEQQLQQATIRLDRVENELDQLRLAELSRIPQDRRAPQLFLGAEISTSDEPKLEHGKDRYLETEIEIDVIDFIDSSVDTFAVSNFDRAINRLTQFGFSAFEAQRIAALEQAKREEMRAIMRLPKPQYQDKANSLLRGFIATLRSELGDYGFENYLRSSAINTAVNVRSIEKRSAAERAGLQRGDKITHYDGLRVFDIQEMIQATQSNVQGGTVQLKFNRGGQALSVVIPRGIVGITGIPFQPHQFFRMGEIQ